MLITANQEPYEENQKLYCSNYEKRYIIRKNYILVFDTHITLFK